MSRVSKRTPYLEIALAVAVMAFLAVVIAGGFNQRNDEAARVTVRAE
jgi:multisubunit Na+/H+ antiporter MnhF subunit